MYAEVMYENLPASNKGNLTPPIDPNVAAKWHLVGYITGKDALLDTQSVGLGATLYYGCLAYSKTDNTQYVAVIRGTDNGMEWIEDAQFLPVPAGGGIPGSVENGFYSIYGSMMYAPFPGGTPQTLAAGIHDAVGPNQVTVIGHSLGSALATYLTLDLAVKAHRSPNTLAACMIASPRTGNAAYAQFFDQNVANYKVYNYSFDVVPKVPLFFDYTALPKTIEITPQNAQANILHTVGCNHHAADYAAMLDFNATDWSQISGIGQGNNHCLLGPA
jgi:hypothetical protein